MIGTALSSSQKLEGAAKHLIDGSEKRIWRLSFQYWSPHVIERHSNLAHGRLSVIHNAAGITSSFLTFVNAVFKPSYKFKFKFKHF